MLPCAKSPEFQSRRAQEYFSQRKIREALRCHEKALKAGFDSERAAYERWTSYMLLGRFERAWKETDRIESVRRRSNASQDRLPLHLRRVWSGADLHGRRVLVRCYHGFGDTIQFIRYITPLAKIARRVVVQCPRELCPLIRSTPGIDSLRALEDSEDASDFDVDIELMELPYAFRTIQRTIPRQIPYVFVPPEMSGLMAKKLAAVESSRKPRIGVVWRSGSWNPLRSIPFDKISELAETSQLTFFSLQRGAEMQHLPFGSRKRSLIQAEAREPNLLHTAATIQNLDLVISVDTMAAHLAGALGKPVLTLLPFDADWRWMLDRADSPWYPSMRLYRQTRGGDWRRVLASVARDLSQLPGVLSLNSSHNATPERFLCARDEGNLGKAPAALGLSLMKENTSTEAKPMARHKLTKAEQEKGVERALESPKTPPQLKKGLQKRKKQLTGK